MLARSLALVAVAVSAMLPASAQDEYRDEIRKLLNDGVELYRRGKLDEAYGKFEEALQKKPDMDLVYAFIKRVGEDVVGSMMNSADPRIKAVGLRIFELSKPGEIFRRDAKTVKKYVADLASDQFEIYRLAHWHLKNYGSWGLRFYLLELGNRKNDRFRSRIMLLLAEMGYEATHATAELLEDARTDEDSVFLRQNAAIVLGNIHDDRAVPALKRTIENPNEAPEVKKYATEAMIKITRKQPSEWRKATDYFFELAENYYYAHPSVVHSWMRAHLVFRWDSEKNTITAREVPRFAWNEQMAEEALYDLLTLDPSYIHPEKGTGWALLACTHYAQALEAEAGIVSAELAMKNADPSIKPEDIDLLKQWLSDTNRHNVLASVPGKRYIYEALARCLKDGNALVGTAAIQTIKEMGRPEDLPGVAVGDGGGGEAGGGMPAIGGALGYPLVEALTNDDKRVRYAASEAMVKINPQSRKLGMELVIPNLVDAVGEQGVRVALVVVDVADDADRNFVNQMRKLLTRINVFPVFATSGEEGILKAKQFPSEDVIIIQKKIAAQIYFKETEVRAPVVETVFDTLRDDIRTRHIPRILLSDNPAELDESRNQYKETAQGFWERGDITGVGGHLKMQGELDKLFDSPEAKKDSKDRADQIARSAAETLATIDVTNTLYPYRDSVDALIRTVSPEILREDFIRIPAARALGHFGDQRALAVLAKALAEKASDDENIARQKGVRLACARAMSQIFQVTGVTPEQDVHDILKNHLRDGDYDIELTVGEALGNAKLTNEQRLDLENFRRVNNRRAAKTPEDE